MILFFKSFYYIILIIIDSILLFLLQIFNPYYGSNSQDDLNWLIGILNELDDLKIKIENIEQKFNYKINKLRIQYEENLLNTVKLSDGFRLFNSFSKETYKLIKQNNKEILEYQKRSNELLIQLHTALFNIVLNG